MNINIFTEVRRVLQGSSIHDQGEDRIQYISTMRTGIGARTPSRTKNDNDYISGSMLLQSTDMADKPPLIEEA